MVFYNGILKWDSSRGFGVGFVFSSVKGLKKGMSGAGFGNDRNHEVDSGESSLDNLFFNSTYINHNVKSLLNIAGFLEDQSEVIYQKIQEATHYYEAYIGKDSIRNGLGVLLKHLAKNTLVYGSHAFEDIKHQLLVHYDLLETDNESLKTLFKSVQAELAKNPTSLEELINEFGPNLLKSRDPEKLVFGIILYQTKFQNPSNQDKDFSKLPEKVGQIIGDTVLTLGFSGIRERFGMGGLVYALSSYTNYVSQDKAQEGKTSRKRSLMSNHTNLLDDINRAYSFYSDLILIDPLLNGIASEQNCEKFVILYKPHLSFRENAEIFINATSDSLKQNKHLEPIFQELGNSSTTRIFLATSLAHIFRQGNPNPYETIQIGDSQIPYTTVILKFKDESEPPEGLINFLIGKLPIHLTEEELPSISRISNKLIELLQISPEGYNAIKLSETILAKRDPEYTEGWIKRVMAVSTQEQLKTLIDNENTLLRLYSTRERNGIIIGGSKITSIGLLSRLEDISDDGIFKEAVKFFKSRNTINLQNDELSSSVGESIIELALTNPKGYLLLHLTSEIVKSKNLNLIKQWVDTLNTEAIREQNLGKLIESGEQLISNQDLMVSSGKIIFPGINPSLQTLVIKFCGTDKVRLNIVIGDLQKLFENLPTIFENNEQHSSKKEIEVILKELFSNDKLEKYKRSLKKPNSSRADRILMLVKDINSK